ncbi:MAG: hypothetical protein IJX47_02315 [Clostridia bacterium]|nr:hypothetical protein [Clostridia bacterium]
MNFFRDIFDQLRLTLKKLFPESKQEGSIFEQRAIRKFGLDYRDVEEINFPAIFADRITTLALDKAVIEVTGDNARADEINRILQAERRHEKKWMRQALGIGAVLLVPYSVGGEVHIDVIPQDRVMIAEHSGCNLRRLSFLADKFDTQHDQFARWSEYSLEGDRCIIRNKATRNGSEIPLTAVKAWEGIPPEIVIGGCDRLLLGYFRCPTDNKSPDILTGVPLTFGCDSTIREIKECMEQMANEFDAKEAWVGVDKRVVPAEQTLKKKNRYVAFNTPGQKIGDGGANLFEVYSPEIRESAYAARLKELYKRLEKQVGTSSGIVSPADDVALQTATQVNRTLYDTLSLVGDCRDAYAYAMDDVIYAINALLDYYGYPGAGLEYDVSYKWSNGILDDATEHMNLMFRAKDAQIISDAELRQEIYPDETREQAEEAVAAIKEANPINSMFEV